MCVPTKLPFPFAPQPLMGQALASLILKALRLR